jgi:hypothetical protein
MNPTTATTTQRTELSMSRSSLAAGEQSGRLVKPPLPMNSTRSAWPAFISAGRPAGLLPKGSSPDPDVRGTSDRLRGGPDPSGGCLVGMLRGGASHDRHEPICRQVGGLE